MSDIDKVIGSYEHAIQSADWADTTEALAVVERARLELAALRRRAQGVDVEAVRDVLAERERQRAKWSAEHDDKHTDGSLSAAAAVLAHPEVDGVFGPDWAFELRVKHDNDDRTRRVIAAALLLAEIERLDRRALARATLPAAKKDAP